MTQDKLLYRVAEAAHALSLSESTVWNLIRARSLPSVLVGRSRRVPAESMRMFVAALEEEHPNGDK